MPAVTGSTEGADGGAAATPVGTDEPTPAATSAAQDRDYEIVTLLPPDAIPAIDDPQFYDVLGADQEYDPEELVLGVEFDGDARAYPIAHLSAHEIVNDTVGGHPLAVTW